MWDMCVHCVGAKKHKTISNLPHFRQNVFDYRYGDTYEYQEDTPESTNIGNPVSKIFRKLLSDCFFSFDFSRSAARISIQRISTNYSIDSKERFIIGRTVFTAEEEFIEFVSILILFIEVVGCRLFLKTKRGGCTSVDWVPDKYHSRRKSIEMSEKVKPGQKFRHSRRCLKANLLFNWAIKYSDLNK